MNQELKSIFACLYFKNQPTSILKLDCKSTAGAFVNDEFMIGKNLHPLSLPFLTTE